MVSRCLRPFIGSRPTARGRAVMWQLNVNIVSTTIIESDFPADKLPVLVWYCGSILGRLRSQSVFVDCQHRLVMAVSTVPSSRFLHTYYHHGILSSGYVLI